MGEFAFALDIDQSGCLQLFHVVRQGGRADVQASTHGFTGHRLLALADTPLEFFEMALELGLYRSSETLLFKSDWPCKFKYGK